MNKNSKNNKNSKKVSNKESENKVVRISESKDFAFVESFKALRTNIMFSLPLKDGVSCRKILFTSAGPGEGKSTATVNFAATLSETETKVLLIDADLRKPTVHKYFNMESRVGLSNLLSGMNKREECIQKASNYKNLSVITSGILPPNPSELLSSSAMDKLFEDFEKEYDYIIIDTPPVNVVTDALAIASKVDGVAVVAAFNRSVIPEVTKAIDALKFAKANILGIVMNRMVSKKGGYGRKSYNYSYKYKYKSYSSKESTDSDN